MQRLARYWLFAAGCVLFVVLSCVVGHYGRRWADAAPRRRRYRPLPRGAGSAAEAAPNVALVDPGVQAEDLDRGGLDDVGNGEDGDADQ